MLVGLVIVVMLVVEVDVENWINGRPSQLRRMDLEGAKMACFEDIARYASLTLMPQAPAKSCDERGIGCWRWSAGWSFVDV